MASELSSEIFMEEIRNYPCLRCKFCKDFKDKYIKLNSWKSVGDKFGLPLDAVVKNYKNIRCSFTRYVKKKNVASGSDRADLPTPVEFQPLDWLLSFTDIHTQSKLTHPIK